MANDAMNKLIRDANGASRWTVVEAETSAGRDWLRGEVDQARLRGTADARAPEDPTVVAPPPTVAHGSADGGAGFGQQTPPPLSMNDWIRGSADASHAAHARDRSR